MKLWETIKKDIRILIRDRSGLLIMFLMPILLVIVVTIMQNNTYEMINENKVDLLVYNADTGEVSEGFIEILSNIGMFDVEVKEEKDVNSFKKQLEQSSAMIGVYIPKKFTNNILAQSKDVSGKALTAFGLEGELNQRTIDSTHNVTLFYNPVIQNTYRMSIEGALNSALQMIGNKYTLRSLFYDINGEEIPDSLEQEMLQNKVNMQTEALTRNKKNVPNATQHNVPAWTIFAMFFIVVSLGASIIREKKNGSFIRLKTLPTNFFKAIISKQITYFMVTILQAILLFSIGFFLFPVIGLPKLPMPNDFIGFIIVTILCGIMAVSFAQAVGTFANTEDQGNGFGAITIVLLSIIGGLMIPAFAMPDGIKTLMKISPLYWCLELYNELFLKGSNLAGLWRKILPLISFIILFQALSYWGLKHKKII